jgi:putative ABC transport system substrate-binding protein
MESRHAKFMGIIAVAALSLVFAGRAGARPMVIAVQSVDVLPYNEALAGFQGTCRAETEKRVIAESSPSQVLRDVKTAKPDLVLAIGMDALNTVKSLRQVPIVYLMVLNPKESASDASHITGVSMNIPENEQLRLIRLVLPGAHRLFVMYDPDNTGRFVTRGQAAARKLGIELLAQPVKSAQEVPTALTHLRSAPDALWLLPDITVIRPETLEFIFQFSLTRKIPVICFSRKYLGLGAFMSIDMDLNDMGRQAGEMANRLLSGQSVQQVPPEEARKAVVTVNRTIGDKLGISIPDVTSANIKIID